MGVTTIEHESVEEPAWGAMPSAASDEQLVAMLVDRARSEGLQLTGEGGLLQMLTKRVLESALEVRFTSETPYPLGLGDLIAAVDGGSTLKQSIV
ncbi:hypothetical protein [Streptomyces sp. NBC_01136]|uniref:hypothetical protein n=1 Tax=Streptomyces sp. NBC_01136 TaxID=2903754 RepID=UPI00386C22C8